MKAIIQVRSTDGRTLGTIKRVLRVKSIGNFNPVFCRYMGNQRVLVQSSDDGISFIVSDTPPPTDAPFVAYKRSQYLGVLAVPIRGRCHWQARYKGKYLGCYENEIDAAKAYALEVKSQSQSVPTAKIMFQL